MSAKEIMVNGKPLTSLRVVDLKEELEKRGLSKSGSKKDLADRLRMNILLENQRNAQNTADEEQLPNLSTREQLEEQNPFIRDYFESQAELYHSQKVVKKLYEGMAQTPEGDQQQPAKSQESSKEVATEEKVGVVEDNQGSVPSKEPVSMEGKTARKSGVAEPDSSDASHQGDEEAKMEERPATPDSNGNVITEKSVRSDISKQEPRGQSQVSVKEEPGTSDVSKEESEPAAQVLQKPGRKASEIAEPEESRASEVTAEEPKASVVVKEESKASEILHEEPKASEIFKEEPKASEVRPEEEPKATEVPPKQEPKEPELSSEEPKVSQVPQQSPKASEPFKEEPKVSEVSKEEPIPIEKPSVPLEQAQRQVGKVKSPEKDSLSETAAAVEPPTTPTASIIPSNDQAKDKSLPRDAEEPPVKEEVKSDQGESSAQPPEPVQEKMIVEEETAAVVVEKVPSPLVETATTTAEATPQSLPDAEEHANEVEDDEEDDDEESDDKKDNEDRTWKRRSKNEDSARGKPSKDRNSKEFIVLEVTKEKSSIVSERRGSSPSSGSENVAAAPASAAVEKMSSHRLTSHSDQMDVDEALDYGEEEADLKRDREEFTWSRRILRLKNRCSIIEKSEKKWSRAERKPVVVTSQVLESFFPDVKPLPESEVRLEDRVPKEPNSEWDKVEQQETPAQDPSSENKSSSDPGVMNVKRKISIIPFEETVKDLSPPRHPPSDILMITNLTRPFTLLQLRELLQRTGTVEDIWVDKIKSKCIAKFEKQAEAEETRAALHGIQWPPSNPKALFVDFTTAAELEEVSKDSGEKKIKSEKPVEANSIPVREWDLGKRSRSRSPGRIKRGRSGSPDRKRVRNSVSPRGRRSPQPDKKSRDHDNSKDETQIKALDELFRKTTTTPCLYWLPLTPEQISEKEELRRKRMIERERRLAEMEKLRPR